MTAHLFGDVPEQTSASSQQHDPMEQLQRDTDVGQRMSLLAIAAFVLGRAGTLYLAAAAGGRGLRADDRQKARRVDKVLAVVLLLSAAYYAWRLFDAQVLTTLPGEGGLLP